MTPAPVISNSSPLICLERIGHLHLLQQLFGTIIVPPAVVREVALRTTLPTWVEVRVLVQSVGPQVLSASLGAGESEAISLAIETGTRLLILDDRPARRLAQALQLPVLGTLGTLVAAKRQRLIPEVRPCLDLLLQHDFRIARRLYEQILADANEPLP